MLNREVTLSERCIGVPIDDQVSIRLESGEMLVSGPNVFMGYMGEERIKRGDFFRTGFNAKTELINSADVYSLTGRTKDFLITTGGEIIAPHPMEEMILKIEGIESVTIVGEGLKYPAAVIVAPGISPGSSSNTLRKDVDDAVNNLFPNSFRVKKFCYLMARRFQSSLTRCYTFEQRMDFAQNMEPLLSKLYNLGK